MLHSPAGWAGATVWHLARRLPAPRNYWRPAAKLPADGASHALTALPEILIARYLGDNSEAARLWFARFGKSCARHAAVDRQFCPESGIPEEFSWN